MSQTPCQNMQTLQLHTTLSLLDVSKQDDSVQTLNQNQTKPKTGKLVNVSSWVKKSTESQSDPSVSHHTAEYCKAAGGGKEKEGTITECLRTSVYPWV